MDSLKQVFSRAHRAVRANPITIWFPMLFGTTVWVFYLLLFVVVITPTIPEVMSLDALTASGELVTRAGAATMTLALVAGLVFMAQTAGALGLRAAAISGGVLDAGHFFRAIKKYFARLCLVYLGMAAVYAVPVVLASLAIVLGPWRASLSGSDPEAVLAVLAPFLTVVPLVMVVINVVLSMWPVVLVLEDGAALRSLFRSLTFFRRNYRQVSAVIMWGWIITLASRMLLQGSALGQLLHMAWSLVISSYMSLMLMVAYLEAESRASQ